MNRFLSFLVALSRWLRRSSAEREAEIVYPGPTPRSQCRGLFFCSFVNMINSISERAQRFPAWPFPLDGAMQLRKVS